jgi:hypothetical protein
MSNEMKIRWNPKALNDADKCIENMADSWQKAEKLTQIALVSVVVCAYTSGDRPTAVTRANRVVEAAKGANTKAIVEWFTLMGFTATKDGFTDAPDRTTIRKLAGEGFADAKELIWSSLKPIKPFAGWNLEAELQKVLTSAGKMSERAANDEAEGELININEAKLEALKQLLAS